MKKKTDCLILRFIFFTALLLPIAPSFAQQNKEDAKLKAIRAVKMMDQEQKYDEAIRLLQESEQLDPSNITYSYEIAYAYYSKQQFDKAIAKLEQIKDRPGTYGRVYQLLGNSYDMNQQPAKATATYEAGLKKFPGSGELYLELGNMMLQAKNYSPALDYYEKGIKADPSFPSNYYWATKLYCSSEEEVWGMIYGEIFMNLERGSKRTAEVSELLYKVYQNEIKFSDEGMNVSFSKNVMVIDDLKKIKKAKLPFGAIYETQMIMSLLGEKSIDLNSLNRARQRFVENYFKGDFAKDYPNTLFDYQWKIKKAGHAEAYNYWLLMMGDETAFAQWRNAHKEQWESFLKWFTDNAIVIDKSHYVHSGQY